MVNVDGEETSYPVKTFEKDMTIEVGKLKGLVMDFEEKWIDLWKIFAAIAGVVTWLFGGAIRRRVRTTLSNIKPKSKPPSTPNLTP